jgi:CheY-like chemotaxis protein
MARILLVDDEPLVLTLLQRFLERQGHHVTICDSAESALDAATQQGCDLLVTDLTLPGMNGDELVTRLRATHADLPAIVASGYPYEPTQPRIRFLQKPFLPQMLAETIADLLGR